MYNPKNGFIPVKAACSERFLLHQCFGGFSGEVVDRNGKAEMEYGFLFHLIQFRTSGNDTKKMGTFAIRLLLFCLC